MSINWFALVFAWLAVLALPGPDVFLVLRLGVRERKAAVLSALGIMSGNLMWITLSVLGITALMRANPVILPVIQLFGVVVLGYLGIVSIKSGIAQLRGKKTATEVKTSKNPWLLGLVTNLANPKALIFFTALLGQFIPAGATWVASLAIIVVMVFIGLTWFVGIAVLSSNARFRAWFQRAAPWFDVVSGAVFVIASIIILVEVVSYMLMLAALGG